MYEPEVGVWRERVTTADPDEADALLTAAYTEHRVETFGNSARFALEMTTAGAGPLALARTRHSMGFRVASEPAEGKFIVVEPTEDTRFHMSCGREEAAAPVMLAPTWAPFRASWDGVVFTSVTLDHAHVARLGAELSGLAPEQVALTAMTPLSPQLGDYWRGLSAHLVRDVLSMDALPPLLLSGMVRQLALGLLTVFPNTTHTLDPASPLVRPGQGGGEPATVRRAAEFIDSHAHEDIDVTAIADAARIGRRALQTAFRQHRDQTPLAYLRQVRMDRAHRDLHAGDPTRGDTVAAICARWGFGNPGRFAVEYAQVHGCSPSETLRR